MRTVLRSLSAVPAAILIVTLSAGLACAAATPAQKCEVTQLKAVGKDAACYATQLAKEVVGGTPELTKCSTPFTTIFTNAENKGGCLTLLTATALNARISDGISSIVSGLHLRLVDNGDGTVTDNNTGLQWEKKDNTCPGIHCVNDVYTWSNGDLDPAPDGSAFTTFLGTLNQCLETTLGSSSGGFASQCDWRLPTIDELQTILVAQCSTAPCIDPTFGPTAAPGGPSGYWSATTSGDSLDLGWFEHFDTLDRPNIDAKSSSKFVRAVRTAFPVPSQNLP
jgi:hypothetical protein